MITPASRGLLYVLVSLAVLLPCWWLSRIQAGDLSSHIYNTWLAQLASQGQTPGLAVIRQSTNVLFDLMLAGLLPLLGAAGAQRIAVSGAVLIFFWGAFAFASVVARRAPWHMAPCLAMLAYGWVFHMGFFNFYLSLGMCCWSLAAWWRPNRWRLAAGAVIALVAVTAHALPVAWMVAVAAYRWVANRTAPRHRPYLMLGVLACAAVTHLVVVSHFLTRWSPRQLASSTGADQFWVFGLRYYIVLMAMLAVWSLLLWDLAARRGLRRVLLDIPFQATVLSGALVVALPGAIQIPGFTHSLVYIAERLSLAVGVCLCALLACARPGRGLRIGVAGAAAVFYGFLYLDEAALNRFEDRIDRAVAGTPRGARVVSLVTDDSSRTFAINHAVDRACIGRCFSYANYEPSAGQFRLRAVAPNPYVMANYRDSFALQMGRYVVRESDPPVWAIRAGEQGNLEVRRLDPGSRCEVQSIPILPPILPPARVHAGANAGHSPGRG